MEEEQKNQIYELLEKIKINDNNKDLVEKIRKDLEEDNMLSMFEALKKLKEQSFELKDEEENENEEEQFMNENQAVEEIASIYPAELGKDDLERKFIGLLLNEPKSIAIYYFKYNECFFANADLLNIYKMILFTDAEKYAPEAAKRDFNFAKVTEESNRFKETLTEN